MDKQFIGEHLLPGQLGHFFVIASFVASLFSGLSFFMAVRTESADPKSSATWIRLGRIGFWIHFSMVLSIFGALYYVIENHLFEYHYAWEHSSISMPGKYLLSCFWEGQQGSFMLWTFWQSLLGLIVMHTSGKLQARVMTIIAFVQLMLGTMLLGFYFGSSLHIGITPFDLLRNAMQNAPIFSSPNYLNFVKDGNGLNVLLQNYWMVIHPPVLFLGFGATLIPFSYCLAAVWAKDFQTFVKPTIAWSLFNGAILGTGIMMGGAWAYESLNFGGYWAWDPVENSSLVPWLVLIAGLHTLLEYKSTGRALKFTLVLLILSHLLVWYSTFLTRTGILGNTSVHAFTGDGSAMFYHLLGVLGCLVVLAVALLAWRWKVMPGLATEEETFTREFWLFIGAAILFISATHIAIMTSIPVWSPAVKWMTGKEFSLLDPMSHYNNVEVWIAILTGVISSSALYMKYKHTDARTLLRQLAIPGVIALVISALVAVFQKINQFQYDLMLFAAVYGMVASLLYAVSVQKGKLRKVGPAVAHFGFAMVLLGILLSSFNKHIISNNNGEIFRFEKKTEKENLKEGMENVILFRRKPVKLDEYLATYRGDSAVDGKDKRVYYKVDFERKDSATGNVQEQFTLYPDAFINPKGQQGLSANPSTKHYWNRDIFTFINAVQTSRPDDPASAKHTEVHNLGDSVLLKFGSYMIFKGFRKVGKETHKDLNDSDMAVAALFSVVDGFDTPMRDMQPIYVLRAGKTVQLISDTLDNLGLDVKFNLSIADDQKPKADVIVHQEDPAENYIVLKAIVFPFINVLWIGVIMMVFGFLISLASMLRQGNATV